MDLENELRQAMAEHVTEVSAARTLAGEARSRHQRTVRRRTTIAMTTAGLVVAVAAGIPAYQSFRPETVGANGPGGHHKHAAVPSPAASPLSGRPTAPTPDPAGSHPAGRPVQRPSGSHGPVLGTAKELLGYLPPGINPRKTCDTQKVATRETTTCRWTGSAGWIEVRIVHDSGLHGPADLGLAPPMATQAKVHGHAALRVTSVPSQLMWIERGGLGVWVSVSPGLNDRLTAIANGVHVG